MGKLEPLLLPLIILLVGLSAFGLGRLSAKPHEGARLIINTPESQVAGVGQALVGNEKAYVASKSGTKYYLPTCSGASRIQEENKVYFATQTQARVAGYEPAANCPGLSE